MSAVRTGIDAATEKVLAGIEDEELASRYPNRTHFVPADQPDHGAMLTGALLDGDPAVLVYPDGREILFTPEGDRGVARFLLRFAALWLRFRGRTRASMAVQLPPRTRVEARDSTGTPIAAG